MEVDWSFVIPCLNEEPHLTETIVRLRRCVPAGVGYEVIVVDHGSTDRSAAVAAELGARVIRRPGVALGALRNAGARAARGRVLLYLDADISLTIQWTRRIPQVAGQVARSPLLLAGSFAVPDPAGSWVGKEWECGRRATGEVATLPGGHMVMSREGFLSVGGFPEDADAGEDEGFSRRVWEAGGRVVAVPELRVIHRGAPQSLRAFVSRHFWHGAGDAKTVGRFVRSQTSVLAAAFFLLHLSPLAILLLPDRPTALHLAGPFLLAGMLPAAATVRRVNGARQCRSLRLLFLFWVYFLVRGASVLAASLGIIRPGRRRDPAPVRQPR